MFRSLVLIIAVIVSLPSRADEIVLWPEGVPEPRVPAEPAEKVEKSPQDGISRRSCVSNPRLVVYDIPRTDPAKLRGAVVVLPGGGFGRLADEHEGSDVCRWFNERGIVSFLCLYRVPTGNMAQPNLGPVLDAQQAVAEVRRRAGDYAIDPAKIALLGFSAGGQATLVAAANGQRIAPAEAGVSCRPDAVVLIYPWQIGGAGNVGLRSDVTIDASTPPIFIAQAANDSASLPEGALNLFTACLAAKVPAELHLYEAGGHGFGMRPRENAPGTASWPASVLDWLRSRGW